MVAQKVPSYGRLECYIIFRQYAVPIATRPSDLVQCNGGRYKGDYIRNLKPTNSYLNLTKSSPVQAEISRTVT